MELSNEKLVLQDKIETLQQKLDYIESLEVNKTKIEQDLDEILERYNIDPTKLTEILVERYELKFEHLPKRKRTKVTSDLIKQILEKVATGQAKTAVAKDLDISAMVVYRAAAGEYNHILNTDKSIKEQCSPVKEESDERLDVLK